MIGLNDSADSKLTLNPDGNEIKVVFGNGLKYELLVDDTGDALNGEDGD